MNNKHHSPTISPKSKLSPTQKNKSPQHNANSPNDPPSPVKILLQNNIKLNTGKDC